MGQQLCHCSAVLYNISNACHQLMTLQMHCPIRSSLAIVDACLLQEWLQIDKQVAMIALGRYESCVRSTLLLCEGYECCEKDGIFTAAFPSPRAAVQWSLTLQLALLKYVTLQIMQCQ